MNSAELRVVARQILRSHDRGGYTIPTAGLYPFQWNWDAGVTALGWMSFEPDRAWEELRQLMKGQWQSGPQAGLIPHIVFHQASESYFPGPEQWGCEADGKVRHLPTTSISQPPVLASMVAAMLRMRPEQTTRHEVLEPIVDALVKYHRWWYRCRDPLDTGLVFSIHPWESGMDNSPAWDAPLEEVPPTTRAYTRKDLNHVDNSMRPSMAFYDRAVRLMDFNKEVNFDPAIIAKTCPYRVQDIGIISILNRASLALAKLCDIFERPQDAIYLRARCAYSTNAIGQLWSEKLQQYVSRDAINGQLLEAPTHAGFLTWHGKLVRPEHNAAQHQCLANWLSQSPYALPSTRVSYEQFDAARYWRGPIWQHITALVAEGLDACGHRATAAQLLVSMQALFEKSGFHEYYHPITGEGLGGKQFSWTAATFLFWDFLSTQGIELHPPSGAA